MLCDVTGSKRDKLDTVEADRTDLVSKQDSLLRQVSLMQQRLSQSQEDLKRLSLGDVPAQLKSAQQERDVLLEFIEGLNRKNIYYVSWVSCCHSILVLIFFSQVICKKAQYWLNK